MKKVFDFWAGLTGTILASVPIIAIIIQITHEAAKIAYISGHIVVAMVILIAGYFLIWSIFKALDKVAGKLGDVASSATGKMQKGLADYRGRTSKKRLGEAIAGKRNIRGAGAAVNLIRRGRMADQGGLQALLPGAAGAAARRRYAGAEATHISHEVDEMMKRDNMRSGGDDLAMKLAMQRGVTEESFLRDYAAASRASDPRLSAAEAGAKADAALSAMQTSFGAELGTDSMRVAAYRSLLNSKTSYADKDGTKASAEAVWGEMIEDGNSLMADGLMNATDVTVAIKQRGDRADRSGVGHGSLQGQVERSYGRYQQGARAGTGIVTRDEAVDMRKEAAFGTGAAAIITGRHEGVAALGGTYTDNVQEAYLNYQTAMAAGGNAPTADQQELIAQTKREYERNLAVSAATLDAASYASPQNGKLLADRHMSQVLYQEEVVDYLPQGPPDPNNNNQPTMVPVTRLDAAGNPVMRDVTIGKDIERKRSSEDFPEFRREYATASTALQGALAQQQQQQQQGQ